MAQGRLGGKVLEVGECKEELAPSQSFSLLRAEPSTPSIPLSLSRYYAAPTMHHAILASKPEGVDARTATSIKMIANAAGGLLPSLAVQLKETFGDCAVLPSYGMTEW